MQEEQGRVEVAKKINLNKKSEVWGNWNWMKTTRRKSTLYRYHLASSNSRGLYVAIKVLNLQSGRSAFSFFSPDIRKWYSQTITRQHTYTETQIKEWTDTRMHNYNYVCILKHKKDCRSNMDLVHKINLLKGVSALKKPVTSRTVLNS